MSIASPRLSCQFCSENRAICWHQNRLGVGPVDAVCSGENPTACSGRQHIEPLGHYLRIIPEKHCATNTGQAEVWHLASQRCKRLIGMALPKSSVRELRMARPSSPGCPMWLRSLLAFQKAASAEAELENNFVTVFFKFKPAYFPP